MIWLLAIAVTVIACAALYYAAAGATVNAGAGGPAVATREHFRLQLAEIEAASAGGRLAADDVVAAKAELARELLRQEREALQAGPRPFDHPLLLPASLVVVAMLAFASYAYLGRPDLPAHPFVAATATPAPAGELDLETAVKTVEARLVTHPDDLRGWQVLAPIYLQAGRYADAERAYRHIAALAPGAEPDTDLAEALMLQNGGAAVGEAADLLHRAVALDPGNVRARFYLAGEAMRLKDYAAAAQQWSDIIGLGKGDETWMPAAQAGLAAAEAGRDGRPLPAAGASDAGASPAIRQMVEGLAGRLQQGGGSLAEWTRLVRSEIVLGDLAKAQQFYDLARRAYPDAAARAELDGLAAQAGLKLAGGTP